MGQADRSGYKTKADNTLRLGSIGGLVRQAQAAAQTAKEQTRFLATKWAEDLRGPNHAIPPPSKPIPPPSAQVYANGKPPGMDTIRAQIQKFYGGVQGETRDILHGFSGKNQEQQDKDSLDAASIAQRGYGLIDDAVGQVKSIIPGAKPYKAPDRPDLNSVRGVREQIDMALRDNTWTPEERQQILGSYRNFVQKFVSSDEDDLRDINNWAVRAAYKQLQKQALDDQQAGQAKGGDAFDDFFGLATKKQDDLGAYYTGPLNSTTEDKYGPGFILSADADGWFKIVSTRDLRHQLATAARDDPAFAARLISGMAAYGAYGGGSDKYAGQRIQFDKNNNPVRATFNTDDEAALGTFLASIAVDQEQAMNAQELVPWDELMDQHAEQNRAIAASPSYGDQGGGGGGRRGYGGGGFGGGGGGGVSYTDSDQLKQLINGIARSRLGYTLNDAQINEFVTDYHTKEAAFVNARIAGQSGMQLDPESQAAAWIESHLRDPMAAQQANTYISSLSAFLLGGSFGSQS